MNARQVTIGLALGLGLLPGTARAEARVGAAAPGFELKDESGKTHTLASYRGKVVVLEWTNPRCPFVKRHYKKQTMTRSARALAQQSGVWLAVNSTYFNQPAESLAWRKAQNLPYPTLQDASGEVGRAYGARTTPQIFVIDTRGILRYAGAIDDDPHEDNQRPTNYALATVAALRAKRPVTPGQTKPYGCSIKYKR